MLRVVRILLVRVLVAFLASSGVTMAQSHAPQSHPSWWGWASPEATALVGIRWETLKLSPFAGAIAEEWNAPAGLTMPDLECLQQARQLLLSSPAFLAVASGDFPAAELRAQATAQAMKPTVYRGVELWISPGKSTLSVARISDQVLLVGLRRTLESAIDRNLAEGERRYSPLLQRAARFSGQDLWVVATQLPDSLASGFVPLDVEARGFEGSVSLSDGIRVEATLAAGSPDEAAVLEGRLRRVAPSLPPVAQGLQVVQAGDVVVLAMVVSREQLAANLLPSNPQPTPAQPPAQPASAAAIPAVVAPPAHTPQAPAPQAQAPVTYAATTAGVTPQPDLKASAIPAKPAPIPAKPAGPRVVHILGLDDGPREITLPPSN